MPRNLIMRLKKTLLVNLKISLGLTLLMILTVLSGCPCNCPEMPLKPTTPVLESIEENEEGGICIDKQDTKDLLHYIDELERGYE